jgi:hypothetical protein
LPPNARLTSCYVSSLACGSDDRTETLNLRNYYLGFEEPQRMVHALAEWSDKDGNHKQAGWISEDALTAKAYYTPPPRESGPTVVLTLAGDRHCIICEQNHHQAGQDARSSSGEILSGSQQAGAYSNLAGCWNPKNHPRVSCPGDLDIYLKRKTVAGPQRFLADVENWRVASESLPAGKSKSLCEIEFPNGCGNYNHDTEPVDQLSVITHELRSRRDSRTCKHVVEAFVQKCNPWAGLTLQERKEKFFAKIKAAVTNFKQTPGIPLNPVYPTMTKASRRDKARHGAPVPNTVKHHLLKPELLECLWTRESAGDYNPLRPTNSACSIGESSAYGLIHVVKTTARDWWNAKQLQNVCSDFRTYFTATNKGEPVSDMHKCTEPDSGVELFRTMSGEPDLQVLTGVKLFNHLLNFQDDMAKVKGQRASDADLIDGALYAWFGEHRCEKAVHSCMSCLQSGHEDESGCLQKVFNCGGGGK